MKFKAYLLGALVSFWLTFLISTFIAGPRLAFYAGLASAFGAWGLASLVMKWVDRPRFKGWGVQ